MNKPTMRPAELEQLIHSRLYRIEDVREDMQADPRLEPKVTTPTWHERDLSGRNWNVPSINLSAQRYEFWVHAIVEHLRWRYDIQPRAPEA